jgi:hypothetical protein
MRRKTLYKPLENVSVLLFALLLALGTGGCPRGSGADLAANETHSVSTPFVTSAGPETSEPASDQSDPQSAGEAALSEPDLADFSLTDESVTANAVSPGGSVSGSISGTWWTEVGSEGAVWYVVAGFRNSSGSWVGGDPVGVTGMQGATLPLYPGQSFLSKAFSGLTAPTDSGTYTVWVQMVPVTTLAGAIAAFETQTATTEKQYHKQVGSVTVGSPDGSEPTPGVTDDYPDTSAEAYTIPIDTVVHGVNESGTDQDWFRIPVSPGDVVDIHVKNLTRKSGVVSVYNEDGEEIDGNGWSGRRQSEAEYRTTIKIIKSDSYLYVLVEGSPDSSGTYYVRYRRHPSPQFEQALFEFVSQDNLVTGDVYQVQYNGYARVSFSQPWGPLPPPKFTFTVLARTRDDNYADVCTNLSGSGDTSYATADFQDGDILDGDTRDPRTVSAKFEFKEWLYADDYPGWMIYVTATASVEMEVPPE